MRRPTPTCGMVETSIIVVVDMTELLLPPDAQDLLFREARTANAFTQEPVTREQVAAIYDLVKYGPTAMNGQPMRILLVRAAMAPRRIFSARVTGS